MMSLLWLIITVIDIFIFFLLASIILSWLVAFEVVNLRNRFVYLVYDFLNRLTEPVLGRIRRFMPNLGGIDLSPLVLLIGLWFTQRLIYEFWPRMM